MSSIIWDDSGTPLDHDEAFAQAMREALSKPNDHAAIAAVLDKVAADSHLDLSLETRMTLGTAAAIVRGAPVLPPIFTKNADGTFRSRYAPEPST